MPEDRSVERVYAHFHRILEELLTRLVAESDVTWLAETGHSLSGDYSSNQYNPAIYVVPDMEPYTDALAELNQVQAEALELTGRNRPGRNLLPPLARSGVTHVRISRYTGQTGRTITREAGVKRLKQLEDLTVDNLKEFEQYASRQDPARRKVEAELRNLRKAVAILEHSAAEELRETYQQTVIRPYVYLLDGSSEQLHMRNSGLIAAGPNVDVDWRQGPRRQRSDKITIAPLATAGPLQFFDLSDWEAAKTGMESQA